jgi:ATP-dependent Clp protease ATP-binding subunit ClpA
MGQIDIEGAGSDPAWERAGVGAWESGAAASARWAGRQQLVKIVELRLEDVRRLLAERKISLELTEAAKELLFAAGYDPSFGARPLKRAIQKLIQDPLALRILDGEVLHGDHVVVNAKLGKMKFTVSKRGEPASAAAR